jgi:hypothetical protein
MPDVSGNQSFSFIGGGNFTTAGQVRVTFTSLAGTGDATIVEANTLGSSGAELSITLDGFHSLTAQQFIL